MRSLAILLAFTMLCAPAAADAAEGDASARPVLKSNVTVDSDLVRIGDLVDNAGAAADIPIFRSPDVGDTGSVPASRVLEAIRSHNLTGVGTNGIAAISVTRAGRAITRQDIEALIIAAVARDRGIDAGNLQVQFDGEVSTVYVEPSVHDGLRVVRLYADRHGRFDVTLDAPESAALRPLRLTGSVFASVEVPILIRQIGQGDTVKSSDISMEHRAKAGLPADIAERQDQVVGMAARRPLRAGEMVRVSDLARPMLVQRDHIVTLVYQSPGVLLTMRAKALEAGAEGDLINVLNTQSNRTLQATVTGLGQVAIVVPERGTVIGRSAMNTTDPRSSSAE